MITSNVPVLSYIQLPVDVWYVFQLHSGKLPLDESVDLAAVATMCSGYVGADLQALCREAAMSALCHSMTATGGKGIKPVGMNDFLEARKKVGPSIVRGIAAEVPEVSWNDIGGLHEVKVPPHTSQLRALSTVSLIYAMYDL